MSFSPQDHQIIPKDNQEKLNRSLEKTIENSEESSIFKTYIEDFNILFMLNRG